MKNKFLLFLFVLLFIVPTINAGLTIMDEELNNLTDTGFNGASLANGNSITVGGWTKVSGVADPTYSSAVTVRQGNTLALDVHQDGNDPTYRYQNLSMQSANFSVAINCDTWADAYIQVQDLFIGRKSACGGGANWCCGDSWATMTVDTGIAQNCGAFVWNLTVSNLPNGTEIAHLQTTGGGNVQTVCNVKASEEGLQEVYVKTYSGDFILSNLVFYNMTEDVVPPTYPPIDVTVLFPPTDEYGFTEDYFLQQGNFDIWINGTHNESTSTVCNFNDTKWTDQGANLAMGFNFTFKNNTVISAGEYYNVVYCNLTGTSNGTAIANFIVDPQAPTLITNFKNNTMRFMQNLTGDFNISDNLLIHSYNLTIDGNQIDGAVHLHVQNYQYNLTYNVSSLSIGKHNLSLKVTDGHTDTKLQKDYKIDTGLFDDYIQYTVDDKTTVKTYLKDHKLTDKWETERLEDRFTQTLYPTTPSDTIVLVEEINEDIYVYSHPKYQQWIVFGEQWKDYVLEDEPNATVSIEVKSKKKVEVTISGIYKHPEVLKFKSFGDVNIVHFNYTFYRINLTEEYNSVVFNGVPFQLSLNTSFGSGLDFDISTHGNPSAILDWNGTNYTTTLTDYTEVYANFTRGFETDFPGIFTNISHRWWFNFSNSSSLVPSDQINNQSLNTVLVSPCNDTAPYEILNITYRDEITNSIYVTASNAYDITITDGIRFYNQKGNFTGHTSNEFCTNLDPSTTTYNWDMYDIFQVSAPGYVTRVLDIDPVVPIGLSNNPQTNLTIYMIDTTNSSTITFNWFTTDFALIDGTMRIYQCLDDGSRVLTDSLPIISGSAIANLEFLTQAYSYDVIIDGVIYQDLDTYTACHVESESPRTFYVDVNPTETASLIGLAGIDCRLNRTANNTVTMTWGSNPEGNGTLENCIQVVRRQVTGDIVFWENCSNASVFTRTVQIPVTGNTYVVQGQLKQDGNMVYCDNKVIFPANDAPGGAFGLFALFGAIILIGTMALIYAGDNVPMLVSAGVGLVATWWIGVLIVDWLSITGLLAFLVIVAVIARHSRSR